MYTPWKKLLDPAIQCCPIELAGRGRRYGEQLYGDIEEAIEDVYQIVEQQVGESRFAFFGHSMGALLGYEVIARLWQRRGCAPMHAFFSGRIPPDLPAGERLHVLPEKQLGERLLQWGGLSKQLSENKDFLRMFLPIIRADLKAVETYSRGTSAYALLPCALSILFGKEDPFFQAEQVSHWVDFTTQTCDFYTFAGGHFYLLEQRTELIQLINGTLCQMIIKANNLSLK
jgi:surfactin synthase thioesterase subunit